MSFANYPECAPGLPNITLVQLQPYSPELNPIENLWRYLKSHHWSNRAYDNYDALEEAAMAAWQNAVLDTELMKTVCTAPPLHPNALIQTGMRISQSV
ncbi:MAG: transposase [Rhodopirellula sp.]|nr:transposase [Rhodopirellula sp.]